MKPEINSPEYYKNELIPSLADAVSQGEEYRQALNHTEVKMVFGHWVGKDKKDQELLKGLSKTVQWHEISLLKEEDLIKAGFAGLGRINHVDANSEYKQSKDIIALSQRVDESLKLYERLDTESLVPWTIHQGSIFWSAEIAQDRANTAIVLGDYEAAEVILSEALAKIFDINSEAKKIDFQTPEEILKAENYSAFKARKKFLGAFSAQGVLWYRKALISKDLSEMGKSVSFVTLAHQKEPNPHRLATVAFKTLRSSLSPEFSGDLKTRAYCLASGFSGVSEAFIDSPKDTISSIKQALRERK